MCSSCSWHAARSRSDLRSATALSVTLEINTGEAGAVKQQNAEQEGEVAAYLVMLDSVNRLLHHSMIIDTSNPKAQQQQLYPPGCCDFPSEQKWNATLACIGHGAQL